MTRETLISEKSIYLKMHVSLWFNAL